MKIKYKGLEEEELEIPRWQLHEVDKRLEGYKADPSKALNFDQALDEIEFKM